MAPKGGNAKKEAGRAKKAETEGKKKEAVAADKERQVADVWSEGAKTASKAKLDKEGKRKAELARKAENAKLLAEEESSAPAKLKSAPTAGAAKKKAAAGGDAKPAGPGAIAAGGGLGGVDASGSGSESAKGDQGDVKEEYAATGIDDALELLEVVNARTDKASVGQQAAGLEKHPERRFKGAFEAYQERELPKIRSEHPGLRLQQYKDLLFKQFQKSPENPFNQVLVSFDATKAEKVEALEKRNKAVEERLRDRTQG